MKEMVRVQKDPSQIFDHDLCNWFGKEVEEETVLQSLSKKIVLVQKDPSQIFGRDSCHRFGCEVGQVTNHKDHIVFVFERVKQANEKFKKKEGKRRDKAGKKKKKRKRK